MKRENIYTGLKCLGLIVLLSFVNVDVVKAQTASFLTGNKTGNLYQTGTLIGLGNGNATVTSPMVSHTTGIFNTHRFYYGDTILNTANSNPTTLTSSRVLGLLGAIGSGADAYIQFRTPGNSTLSSGITTYFKIGSAPVITGLSASVGGLLGLSNVYDISGRGYSGAGNYVLGASYNENAGSAVGTTNGTVTQLLLDKNNVWYAAVTPDAAYNSVRLNVALSNTISLLNVTRDLDVDVYSAFYYPAPSGTDCGTPLFTSPGEVQGVSLNLGSTTQLLALDSAIMNPEYAIDDDTNTYSRITSGVLGIATHVSQTVFFYGSGTTGDVVKIKMSMPLSALTAAVLSNLTVTAYNGTTQVGSSQSLTSLLSVDLLGALGDYTPFYVNVTPGGQFDRVRISLGNLVNIGSNILGGGIRIYHLQRVTNAPVITIQPLADTVCEGATASFNITASGTNLSYLWQYESNGSWVSAGTTNPLYIYNTTNAMDGRVFKVNVTGGACPLSQATYTSDEAELKVNALPSNPPVHIGP